MAPPVPLYPAMPAARADLIFFMARAWPEHRQCRLLLLTVGELEGDDDVVRQRDGLRVLDDEQREGQQPERGQLLVDLLEQILMSPLARLSF